MLPLRPICARTRPRILTITTHPTTLFTLISVSNVIISLRPEMTTVHSIILLAMSILTKNDFCIPGQAMSGAGIGAGAGGASDLSSSSSPAAAGYPDFPPSPDSWLGEHYSPRGFP